jgi:DNA processing protein
MQYSKLSHEDTHYPDMLRQIKPAPKLLYISGKLPNGPYVAIVGSRRPTDYGRQVTYRLAGELAAAGVVIVSGLALGVDGLAHQAALEAGGVTVAVLGTAIDDIYPASNRGLARRILEKGAVVSEYGPGQSTHRGSFPARNRIISGLSLAVIVTEADASSGSLITANFALNQDRLVLAVPGNITSPRSAGPNNLLRSGAIPVTSASDVLAALDLDSPALVKAPVKADSREEADILRLLGEGVHTSQDLIERTGLNAAQFANIISLMEITGKVRNLGAGQWIAR